MRFLVLCMALTLCGCAHSYVISSNPSSVVINHDGSVAQATQIGSQECSKYGKDARLNNIHGLFISFDCVAR